jgi:ParB-like chromosome segregation protein Spo0J
MKIENIKTVSLVPYARNAKRHDEAQVAKIAGSIKEYGFTNPILIDKENGIIAGHGRVLAAQKLGLVEVPCIRLDHLTDAQRRAYILADNRLAEIGGGWDLEMLKLELEELDIPLEDVGFDSSFVESPDFSPGTEEDQGKLDEKTPIECPHCHKHFVL